MKPLRQFWALAQLWIAVALRLRAGWAVGAAAVALVAGGALVRELHFGSAEAGFLVDYAAGVVAAGGAVLAALVGPALFFEGLRSHTTAVVLLHGARRSAVAGAQILATGVVLGWMTVLGILATLALLQATGHGAVAGEAGRALARASGPLLVLAPAGVFLASLVRSALLATVLTLALAVAGHLAPVIGHAAAAATGLARAGWTLLSWLIPNFGVADAAPAARAGAYFVAYAAVYTVLAGWSFSRREL